MRSLLHHGATVFAGSVVGTCQGDTARAATYAEVAERVARLAGGLARLGIREGDRVGTFLANTQEHFEAYLGVPSMGPVLHPLNLRLFPGQLAYVVNHGQDKVILVDAAVLGQLAKVAPSLKTVQACVLVGEADTSGLGDVPVHRYEELLAAAESSYPWPDLDERAPMAMCYTSGTTGNSKGVVCSHRYTYLHSPASAMGERLGLSERDMVLPVVPIFYANGVGAGLCGVVGRDRIPAPGPLPAGSAARADDPRAPVDRGRRGSDDLERPCCPTSMPTPRT